jgi:ferredoxin-NADP reductase
MAMLRHHAAVDHDRGMHLVYSARTQADLLYRDELASLADGRRAVTTTLTREDAAAWSGRRGRVDAGLLAEAGWLPDVEPRCYVCGPTPFVEATANALVGLGHQAMNIRTERFGPTGG